MDLINQASFTIDANFCQTFGTFEEGRKLLADIDCERCMEAWIMDEARLDWNSYRQK